MRAVGGSRTTSSVGLPPPPSGTNELLHRSRSQSTDDRANPLFDGDDSNPVALDDAVTPMRRTQSLTQLTLDTVSCVPNLTPVVRRVPPNTSLSRRCARNARDRGRGAHRAHLRRDVSVHSLASVSSVDTATDARRTLPTNNTNVELTAESESTVRTLSSLLPRAFNDERTQAKCTLSRCLGHRVPR